MTVLRLTPSFKSLFSMFAIIYSDRYGCHHQLLFTKALLLYLFQQTKEKPVVNWPAPSDKDIFTLALIDPGKNIICYISTFVLLISFVDSPGRDDPNKRPFLHWLV